MRFYKRQKAGPWWFDLSIDGTRIRQSTGTTDRRAAEELAAKVANDYWRQKKLGERPSVTWEAAVVHWLKQNQHLRSLETTKQRLRWLTAQLKGECVRDIGRDRIQAIIEAKLQDGVTGATVNRHMAALSVVLHHCHAEGWIDAVPPIRKLPESNARLTWLTRPQAQRLLAELPPHLRQMARFALATGLRESNVRLLEWSQVDMDRAVAWIHADQAKAGKVISVPLNEDALAVLAEQAKEKKRYVFNYKGAPVGRIYNHAWQKACARAGLHGLRFHDLRHTWASWHVQAGTPLPVLQQLGGWASYQMVLRYAHLGRDHVAAYADNVGTLWHKSGTAPETKTDAEASVPLQNLVVDSTATVNPLSSMMPRRPHGGGYRRNEQGHM
ncbi:MULTISPECIES: site-specific integrase [Ralstonia]|uniref:tyrosine-type recombinase/integrase n=1 Tax=Ralstonia TaxID=48736 RepID=UPI000A6E05A6|nr:MULTISPECIES: site-specific integrase [Ralstonia]PLT16307.1 site-specific integrase [Ralstonia mannitolilytica]